MEKDHLYQRDKADDHVPAAEAHPRGVFSDELFRNIRSGVAVLEALRGEKTFALSDINAAAEALTGLTRSEAVGRDIAELLPEVIENGLLDVLRRVFSSGTAEDLPLTFSRDGQIVRWLDCRISQISSGQVMIVFDDLTDRKRLETALFDSENRYQRITELITDYLYTVVLDGDKVVETHHGPGCLAITGYSTEEFLADPYLWFRMVADEDRPAVLDHFNKIIGNIASSAIEHRISRKDGQQKWVRNTPVIYRDASGKMTSYHGFVQDITETKLAKKEKDLLESRLGQAQKMEAMGTLAGGIAHDFNNILASIMSYTELSLLRLTDKRIIHYLEQVLKGCDRATGLVQQILTFSRHTDPEKRNINIKMIAKEALQLLRSSLPATIEIRQRFDSKPCQVMADPTEIHQIIMNLCTNSAHAMRGKGGVLDVDIRPVNFANEQEIPIPDLLPGPYARIVVQDEGHGIDPAIADKIFDPFFTTKSPGEGTGMGLSVVYGIVKKNGGGVQMTSEPGKGATFLIYFPLIVEAEAVLPEDEALPPYGTGHILFVDDELQICRASEESLRSLGYTVDVFTESEEALRIFRRNPEQYDLVITDMTMPKMTGATLAGELLKISPDIPIIVCTGYSENIEDQMQQLGVRRLLLKPLKRFALATAVRETLQLTVGGGRVEGTIPSQVCFFS